MDGANAGAVGGLTLLVTGGAKQGKSVFTVALARSLPPPRYYIAAMEPFDEQWRARAERHRSARGADFETIERRRDLSGLSLPNRGAALLECIPNLTANEMFRPDYSIVPDARTRILNGVESLAAQCETLIVVTNEIGRDAHGFDAASMEYIEALGAINNALAARFGVVAE
ncbi:MAG: bifunctional adenosylcobinamide kinase/adenosylcobinamide-phosphate guanylyltransferase, partial [Oscillospiraceae bacterium]|nr:bifunctional adenosylcobinamide kinase/adenosylcobinamide-phosphate guanylyltransferase [Oscillospiraceae bacterium]